MIGVIVWGACTILMFVMLLDQLKIWQTRVGHLTWKIWEIVFPLFMIWGCIDWWWHPIWFGPFWGRVMAVFITFVTIELFWSLYKKWRNNDTRQASGL